jgi:predicted transcriptional regulator
LAGYRTHVSIIADILSTAKKYSYEGYENGATVTHLIRRASVPHQRLSSMVSRLKESGLLYEDSAKYRISDKGILFLNAYTEFKDFAQSFGLKI